MPVQEPATLQVQGADPIPVLIVDVSQGGMGIRTPFLLVPGTRVQIYIGRTVVLAGEVRHTKITRDEYYAGVRIEDLADCRTIPFDRTRV